MANLLPPILSAIEPNAFGHPDRGPVSDCALYNIVKARSSRRRALSFLFPRLSSASARKGSICYNQAI